MLSPKCEFARSSIFLELVLVCGCSSRVIFAKVALYHGYKEIIALTLNRFGYSFRFFIRMFG